MLVSEAPAGFSQRFPHPRAFTELLRDLSVPSSVSFLFPLLQSLPHPLVVQFQHQITGKVSQKKKIINKNSSFSFFIKYQRREYILDVYPKTLKISDDIFLTSLAMNASKPYSSPSL